jgi:integrase
MATTTSDKPKAKAKFIEKLKLTEKTVASAKPTAELSGGLPCSKLYFDTDQPGFGLAVSAKGVKSFFVMRRVQDKQVRYVFGRATDLTVAQARTQAAELWGQMYRGINPMEEKRKADEAAKLAKVRGITLAKAIDLYEGTLRAKGRAERTIEDYRYLVEKYLAAWLERPLAELTRTEVRQRHADIAKEIARGAHTLTKGKKGRGKHVRPRGEGFGTRTANHVMRAFRAIYNRALREDADLPVNPIINVDWNKEQRRTSRIPAAGVKEWYEGVTAITNPVRRDYLLFTLFSGLRKTNAAEPRWEHVDFERKALHVPKPKSQRPFDLPLSDYLVDLLKARKKENAKLAPKSPWVFPAARGEGHIVDARMKNGSAVTKSKGGRSKKAAVAVPTQPRYTPHDLRRTFISVAESLGISREARQLLVNHATPKADVHGGYVIPELDDLRAHMQQISTRLLALCEPPPPSTVVVQMRKKTKRAA